MADFDDVRRLALAFPETTEAVSRGSAHWRVHAAGRDRGFVWERPLRKNELAHLKSLGASGAEASGAAASGAVEPVLGARVEDEAVKFALVDEDPSVFFTTPHFDGFPAILIWLERIQQRRLEEVVTDAWIAMAPPALADAWLAEDPD
jgi:hypothetical protein